MAEHLSVEEVADIKDMFQKMDINNSGKITFEELKLGLHKLGHQVPDSDAKILMEAVSSRPYCFLVVLLFFMHTVCILRWSCLC